MTQTAICGSDLHRYEGRAGAEPGMAFGHEIVGEVGDGVERLSPGDRVVLPFNVVCGYCRNCEDGHYGYCENVESETPGGAYGYVKMGSYQGESASDVSRENLFTVLNQRIDAIRPTEDDRHRRPLRLRRPRPAGPRGRAGHLRVTLGTAFEKGLRFGMGQRPVKRYNRRLRDMIDTGKVEPGSSSPTRRRSWRHPRCTNGSTNAKKV